MERIRGRLRTKAQFPAWAKEFKAVLAELREKGIPGAEVARKIDAHRTAIYHWSYGRQLPSKQGIDRLCEALPEHGARLRRAWIAESMPEVTGLTNAVGDLSMQLSAVKSEAADLRKSLDAVSLSGPKERAVLADLVAAARKHPLGPLRALVLARDFLIGAAQVAGKR